MRLSILAFVVIVGAVILEIFGARSQFTATVGSAAIVHKDIDIIRSLINATAAPTIGRYDSLDTPRGTDYIVAAGHEFFVTGLVFTPGAADAVIEIGYADAHVEDSVSAPSGNQTLLTVKIPAASGLERVPLSVPGIPSGKSLWVRVSGGAGAWPSDVVIVGLQVKE